MLIYNVSSYDYKVVYLIIVRYNQSYKYKTPFKGL